MWRARRSPSTSLALRSSERCSGSLQWRLERDFKPFASRLFITKTPWANSTLPQTLAGRCSTSLSVYATRIPLAARAIIRKFRTSIAVSVKAPAEPKPLFEIPQAGLVIYLDDSRRIMFMCLFAVSVVNVLIWSVYILMQYDSYRAGLEQGQERKLNLEKYMTFLFSIICTGIFPAALVFVARRSVREIRLLPSAEPGQPNVGAFLRLTPYAFYGAGKGRSSIIPVEQILEVTQDSAFHKVRVAKQTFRYYLAKQGKVLNEAALWAALKGKKVVFK